MSAARQAYLSRIDIDMTTPTSGKAWVTATDLEIGRVYRIERGAGESWELMHYHTASYPMHSWWITLTAAGQMVRIVEVVR